VALASDLIAMVPALYLLNQAMTERVHVFELPFKTRTITVSQMWHPRMERDPAHRWLRKRSWRCAARFADAQSTFPAR
jgi:DNA-binding transcriptional LysR family regulator